MSKSTKKSPKKSAKPTKQPTKNKTDSPKQSPETKVKKSPKKPFILFRPFVALGRYLAASWREIRQVRWPNRKATWKMVGAVLIYTAIFVIFIMVFDTLLTLLFNFILAPKSV